CPPNIYGHVDGPGARHDERRAQREERGYDGDHQLRHDQQNLTEVRRFSADRMGDELHQSDGDTRLGLRQAGEAPSNLRGLLVGHHRHRYAGEARVEGAGKRHELLGDLDGLLGMRLPIFRRLDQTLLIRPRIRSDERLIGEMGERRYRKVTATATDPGKPRWSPLVPPLVQLPDGVIDLEEEVLDRVFQVVMEHRASPTAAGPAPRPAIVR